MATGEVDRYPGGPAYRRRGTPVSRWHLGALILLAGALLLATSSRAPARPWLCLPPVFDGGQRLHSLPSPQIFWLELLLRQHELCWRPAAAPDELRVVLVGNSAVYGFPLPAEQTLAAELNAHFAAGGIPAHVFNLGFVNTYQVRDAMIIREALAYDPDVIVYPLTLAEFVHVAPVPFPSLVQFFDSNRLRLAAMVGDPPPGLEEPFLRYANFLHRPRADYHATDPLREAGAFLRLGAHASAQSIVARIHSPAPGYQHAPTSRKDQYDCDQVAATNATQFRDWNQWNILAYLAELHRGRGIDVLVVDWPVAHEPIGECYNARYTAALDSEFVSWLRTQTAALDLAYLDLHDLLPAGEFIDSLHVSAEGHRRIATEVARVLDPMLRDLERRRATERAGQRQ